MRSLCKPIDLEKVRAVIYHAPEGQAYTVKIEVMDQFKELGLGELCDTSEIDGNVHFYPRGYA